MLQAFWWDCRPPDGRPHAWWVHLAGLVPGLAAAGFTHLWLPPPGKAANLGGSLSMGYDPYDPFDLGEHDQRGAIPTAYGTRAELEALIAVAHEHGLRVLADVVLNHSNGADEPEVNPEDGVERWTRFRPKSGKFPRDWSHFHPRRCGCEDGAVFEDMPDLCHEHPEVYDWLLEYGRWLVEDVGFDGFRYDCVKGFRPRIVVDLQRRPYRRGDEDLVPFGVGEHWAPDPAVREWLAGSEGPNAASAFDFELRGRLRAVLRGEASLPDLAAADTIARALPTRAVTFVENHDTAQREPMDPAERRLAYAFVATHEGVPCVHLPDWLSFAEVGATHGLDALLRAHALAAGPVAVLLATDQVYVMARDGLWLVWNLDRAERAAPRVETGAEGAVPIAWWGEGDDLALEPVTAADGGMILPAPRRGYAVWVAR